MNWKVAVRCNTKVSITGKRLVRSSKFQKLADLPECPPSFCDHNFGFYCFKLVKMGSTCFELSEIRGCVCSPVGEVCNNKTSEHAELKLTLREGSARSILSLTQQQKGWRAPALRSFFFPCWCTLLLYDGQESKKGVRALLTELCFFQIGPSQSCFSALQKRGCVPCQDLWRHLPNAKRERVKKKILYYCSGSCFYNYYGKGTRQFSNQPFLRSSFCSLAFIYIEAEKTMHTPHYYNHSIDPLLLSMNESSFARKLLFSWAS